MTLQEDPDLEVVTLESAGGMASDGEGVSEGVDPPTNDE